MQDSTPKTEHYQLFQYASCPFCHRVRRFLDDAGIDVPMRDILTERAAYEELVRGGGRQTVPCLRIERVGDTGGEVEWLYESRDIMAYLASRYGV